MRFITFLFIASSSLYANANTRPAFCDQPDRVLTPFETTQCMQEDTMQEMPGNSAGTGGCEFSVFFKYENGNSNGLVGPLASGTVLDSKCKALGNNKFLQQAAECQKIPERHTRHFEVRNNLKVLFSKSLNCKGLIEAEVKPIPAQERPLRPYLEDERRRQNRGNLGAP
jgi:hypothetical protein